MPSGRPLLFGTNFKMTQTPSESAAFFRDLISGLQVPPRVQLFVIPPFTSLPAVTAIAAETGTDVWVGAQNMHWAPSGAHTGEISGPMLRALGVDLALLGHAERRRDAHETDQDLNKKVLAATEQGLRVLLCVGETAEERGYGVGGETVARQLKIGLHGLPTERAPLVQIAYEPVWSIGAGGTPAHPGDVAPIAGLIRSTLVARFGEAGLGLPILYGGSVDPGNAASFVALDDIDGLFVGRAAWSVEGYRNVLDAALRQRFGTGLA